MNKADIAWFIKHAVIAIPYIQGNKDRERYVKLVAQAGKELKPAVRKTSARTAE